MKTFLSKHTLHKILSLIKLDLSHKVDSRDQLTEDDVRLIWNEVTGKDIPNILSLQHNHDDLYSKLDHNHNSLYSTINHNHDNKYSSISHNHDTVYSKLNHNHDNLYRLSGGIKIPNNSDLNSYTDIGNYYCALNATALTLKNCPISDAFTLKVEHGAGLSYIIQTIRCFHNGNILFRLRSASSSANDYWDPWRIIRTEAIS